MAITTALTRLLGVTHPIILAPMGGVAGGKLAAAVSQAGGFGMIGGGYGNPKAGYGGTAWMDEQFRAAGNAQIGVGYITWSLQQFPELFDQAMEHAPKVFGLAFGDEMQFAPRIKKAGIKLLCQVQDLDGAKRALDAGTDIIVAQGTEAGGHGKSGRTTLTLTPAIVDIAGNVPVVAAGGLSDGRGLAAALMLGAAGILVGTRFWASPEALGSDKVKQLLTEARSDDTLRTRVFDIVRDLPWPDGYTGRALVNDFSRKWHGNEGALEKNLPREADAYWMAARAGDTNTSVVFAGEGLDLIHDIKPAGDIVRTIAAEAEELLKGKAGAVLN
ncbi:MAG TPA: nitronate monooxygenase [Nordella sp.]|nr:nitronate monooxygenase [Nordella sp.]